MNLDSQLKEFRSALLTAAASYRLALAPETLAGLSRYYELLNSWNAHLHLVAPCSPREFATRHVLESLLLVQYLPKDASVADIGSGAGLPIIPCLIARPDLQAVLIECSKKKAVFLREALKVTTTFKRVTVIAERFENVAAPEVGFVTCRALERFEEMLPALRQWAPTKSTFLLFGGEGLRKRIEKWGGDYKAVPVPNSRRRFLFVVKKIKSD